jgi:hypothetical protein
VIGSPVENLASRRVRVMVLPSSETYIIRDQWMRQVICTFFSNRLKEVVDSNCEFFLDFHITDFADAIAFFQIVHFRFGWIEGIVIDEHGIAFNGPRVSGTQTFRIGIHVHHFLPDCVRVV